jgi:hypothetical protein
VRDDGQVFMVELVGTLREERLLAKMARGAMLAVSGACVAYVLSPRLGDALRTTPVAAGLVDDAVGVFALLDDPSTARRAQGRLGLVWWRDWFAGDGELTDAGRRGRLWTVEGYVDPFGQQRRPRARSSGTCRQKPGITSEGQRASAFPDGRRSTALVAAAAHARHRPPSRRAEGQRDGHDPT